MQEQHGQQSQQQDALATVEEAARSLRVSRSKLYQMMDQGELEHVKIGKCRRVPWEALRKLVERSTVKPGVAV
jgi:excisionase family DNA binding protein